MEVFCFLVDEHVLDAIHLLSANRDAWWWPRCLLHLLSFAFGSLFGPVFMLCCGSDVFFLGSFCNKVPLFLLSSVIPKILLMPVVFPISLENVVGLSSLLLPRPVVFSLGFSVSKENAHVVNILEKYMTFLRTCSVTSSLAPSTRSPHLQVVCPRSFVIKTRLALYCVCHHANSMSFKIALCLLTLS